jgi:hypothetical protein
MNDNVRSRWEDVGPFFDRPGLLRWSGWSASDLHAKVEANQVLLTQASDGSELFPDWQFDDAANLLPHMSELLSFLSRAYDPWDTAAWLSTRLPAWGDRTAWQVLRADDPQEVAEVLLEARHDAGSMLSP